VDETYVKVKGSWIYLDRAVDRSGQTIDLLLSAKRGAAKQFFRKPSVQPHTVNAHTITVDENAACPKAAAKTKRDAFTANAKRCNNRVSHKDASIPDRSSHIGRYGSCYGPKILT
jgi:transposase-like protein